jgi:hypothetical protein
MNWTGFLQTSLIILFDAGCPVYCEAQRWRLTKVVIASGRGLAPYVPYVILVASYNPQITVRDLVRSRYSVWLREHVTQ